GRRNGSRARRKTRPALEDRPRSAPGARRSRELLLVRVVSAGDVHAHALVQPDSAGRVLPVDAEADPRSAAPPEVPEGVPQESGRQPAPAPGLAHAEVPDPAELRIAGEMPGVERVGRELLPILDEPPERRVETVGQGKLAPLLERGALELPVVGEGIHVRLIDAFIFAGAEVARREPVRPDRLGWVFPEVDPHLNGVADRLPADLLEHLAQNRIVPLYKRAYDRGTLLAADRLSLGEQRRLHFGVEGTGVCGKAAAVLGIHVEVADELPLAFGDADDELRPREPAPDLLFAQLGLPEGGLCVLLDHLPDRVHLVDGRLADLDRHASSASVSARRSRSGSSRVGRGPGGSPSRLIQIDGSLSPVAGAMSWKRLAATWTSGG